VKYALLGYDAKGSLDSLDAQDKRALHREHRTLHDDSQAPASASVSVIAHYRFRPARGATTVRRSHGEVVRTTGSYSETNEALRALYLVESDDPDAVLDLATSLPAVHMGGTVEVRPLIEPVGDTKAPTRHRGHSPRPSPANPKGPRNLTARGSHGPPSTPG
jgi:hypothetical protein